MNIEQYRQNIEKPLSKRAIGFLIDDDKVLLGRKKDGRGEGRWVGIGGKLKKGESVEEAFEREMEEETGLRPVKFEKSAVVNFYFPHKEKWDQQVHAFIASEWEGELGETDEIFPQWFPINEIPLDQMWDDARIWIPNILKGGNIEVDILYGEDNLVQEFIEIKE